MKCHAYNIWAQLLAMNKGFPVFQTQQVNDKTISTVKPGVSELFDEKGNLPLPGLLLSSRKFVLKINFGPSFLP